MATNIGNGNNQGPTEQGKRWISPSLRLLSKKLNSYRMPGFRRTERLTQVKPRLRRFSHGSPLTYATLILGFVSCEAIASIPGRLEFSQADRGHFNAASEACGPAIIFDINDAVLATDIFTFYRSALGCFGVGEDRYCQTYVFDPGTLICEGTFFSRGSGVQLTDSDLTHFGLTNPFVSSEGGQRPISFVTIPPDLIVFTAKNRIQFLYLPEQQETKE